MSILDKKGYYKPFKYPWAFDYYDMQQKMHWLPREVPLHEDVADWTKRLSEEERNLLTQIFRFFTQGDVDIAEAYRMKYMPRFQNEEVSMMLASFSAMEAVHAHAYSYLLDTVGMPETEYQAFSQYKEMAAKHEFMSKAWEEDLTPEEKAALDLALFSAFGEGMQLFSSFAILLSFPRFGKMKGMGQIVTWSIRDESLHVEGMLKVFEAFVDEHPEVWTERVKRIIYDTCRTMVDLEDAFIDLAFKEGPVEGLEPELVKQYIRHIADRRLLQLGLKPNYGVKKNPLPWINEMVGAAEHTNFFENRPTEYAKASVTGQWSDAFG